MVRSWSWGQDQVCPDSCLCFSPEPSFVGDPMAMTSLLLPVEMAMWSYTNTSPKLEKLICFNPRRSHIRSLWIHPNSLTWPPFWPSFAWTIHDRIDLSNEEITFPNGNDVGTAVVPLKDLSKGHYLNTSPRVSSITNKELMETRISVRYPYSRISRGESLAGIHKISIQGPP
jgi:hypothetical protein